ncbi:MAG: hypothetical protein AB7O68_17385 [Pirellulales bacterium]
MSTRFIAVDPTIWYFLQIVRTLVVPRVVAQNSGRIVQLWTTTQQLCDGAFVGLTRHEFELGPRDLPVEDSYNWPRFKRLFGRISSKGRLDWNRPIGKWVKARFAPSVADGPNAIAEWELLTDEEVGSLIAKIPTARFTALAPPASDRVPSTGVQQLDSRYFERVGFGIDEQKNVWFFDTCPAAGEVVRLSAARQLTLPTKDGVRMPCLLKQLAESKDGRTARKTDLSTAFGIRAGDDARYDVESDAELHGRAKTISEALRKTISYVSQDIRHAVGGKGTKGSKTYPLLQSDGPCYRAAFTTRFLCRDGNDKWRFGECD